MDDNELDARIASRIAAGEAVRQAQKKAEITPARDISQFPPLFTVQGLTFYYNVNARLASRAALRDISFDLRQSEFLVVIGQSGCGKTTLLELLRGKLRNIWSSGKITSSVSNWRLKAGIMDEDDHDKSWAVGKTARELSEKGRGTIIVTHQLDQVFAFADRILFLHKGQVGFHGTPDQIRQGLEAETLPDPLHRYMGQAQKVCKWNP